MESSSAALQKFYQTIWPDISEDQLSVIMSKHIFQTIRKGEKLLRFGDVCDWSALVTRGVMRYYHAVEGKEHVGQIFFPGMVVSDYVSYVQGTSSRIFIDAVQESEIALLKKQEAEEFKRTVPGYLEMVIKYLDIIYISNFERYSSLLLDSAEVRYLKLLKNRPEVVRQVPNYMIASFLGMTPEALSRIRNKIAHSGA